jgi:hypothetical protein
MRIITVFKIILISGLNLANAQIPLPRLSSLEILLNSNYIPALEFLEGMESAQLGYAMKSQDIWMLQNLQQQKEYPVHLYAHNSEGKSPI